MPQEVIYKKELKSFEVGEHRIPFPFPDKRGDSDFVFQGVENYLVADYFKHNVAENDIKVLYLKSPGRGERHRIGWAIPYNSLLSAEHSFHDNEHFAEYAFAAYNILLSREELQDKLDGGLTFETAVTEIYKDSIQERTGDIDVSRVLFIAEKSNIDDADFTFADTDFSAMTYGYFPRENQHANTQYLTSTNDIIELVTNENIKTVIRNRHLEQFFDELPSNISDQNNQSIVFQYLYQVIEILIEEELINRLETMLNDFKDGKTSIRDSQTALGNATEIKRIEKIFSGSGIRVVKTDKIGDGVEEAPAAAIDTGAEIAGELHRLCNDFMVSKGREGYDFPNSFYQFRNMMVHRLRLVHRDTEQVRAINEIFEIAIYFLLSRYRKYKT